MKKTVAVLGIILLMIFAAKYGSEEKTSISDAAFEVMDAICEREELAVFFGLDENGAAEVFNRETEKEFV